MLTLKFHSSLEDLSKNGQRQPQQGRSSFRYEGFELCGGAIRYRVSDSDSTFSSVGQRYTMKEGEAFHVYIDSEDMKEYNV